MYGISRAAPHPWDVTLEHALLEEKLGLLLVADQDGVQLLRKLVTGLEGITPTNFSYASGSPFARRTARFSRLVMGMGQAVQESEASQRYSWTLGVDHSCGLEFLAPEFAEPFQVGTGPIRDITQFVYGGVTTLALISGSGVYLSSAGTINDPTDFSLAKDFAAALATPSAPTATAHHLAAPTAIGVSPVGATGSTQYDYQIVAIGPANPPRSAPSNTVTISNGNATLSHSDHNTITWSGATMTGGGYEIWRTMGGTVGKIAVVSEFTSSYDDEDDVTVITPGSPPATALNGAATAYQYKVTAIGTTASAGAAIAYPTSAASPASTALTDAAAALSTFVYNVVSWSAVVGALGYQIWRTAGPGTVPRLIGQVNAPTTTFNDQADNGVALLTPPSASVVQTPRMFVVTSQFSNHQKLYVAVDVGNYWAYDPATATWEQADWTGPALWEERGLFFRYDTLLHKIRSTNGDPLHALSGAWTDYYGTDDAYQITRIVPFNGTVLLFDEQRVHMATADLTPNANAGPSLDNGRTAIPWLGAVYTPFGTGWYRYTVSGDGVAFESVGIERLLENDSPIHGRVTAQVGWNAWHQFFIEYDDVADTSYLMKFGAWSSPEEANSPSSSLLPVIHGALESWAKKGTWLAISTAGEPTGNPRLYVGFDDGYLTSAILPRSNPFAPNDASCRFRSSGYTVLPRHHMGFQADNKAFGDLTAFGPLLDDTCYVLGFYDREDDAEQELLGTIRQNGDVLTFAEGVVGRWIRLRFELHTSDPTLTPIVEGYALHEQLKPAFVEQFSLTARTGPRLVNRRGNPTNVSGDTLLRQLRDLAAVGDSIILTLPDHSIHTVAVLDCADRLLPGNAAAAEQHAVSLTLAKFSLTLPSTA